ncbi:MAG: NUDIX hydrolase [bacterium]|nr:NUDIX hydrolase [bacterium]
MRKEKLEELRNLIEELKSVRCEKRRDGKNFLTNIPYSFKLNNGRVLYRERLIKGGKDGSATIIMPVLSNTEILTVIEPRVFTELTVGVGFPAGYVENGENPIEGARRELKEETGYVSSKLIEIDSYYQDEGCSSALNRLYLALDCKKKYNQSLDKDEIVRYMSFTYDELFELEKMGYIRGGNSKLLLEKSKTYMKGR